MGRKHYMRDSIKITRRIPNLNRGIVENVNRGLIEENPDACFESERTEESDWIPARLRTPGGDESADTEVKIDLPVTYELVMLVKDASGHEVCLKQHDELIIRYRRDNELVETSARMRITGTIQEIRKRSRLYSYVMPVVLDTEF